MRTAKPAARMTSRIIFAAALILGSASAAATAISGDWIGNWSGSGITATFNMSIGPQDELGRFSGHFDWTCTSGIACSGIETFTGGLGFGDSFAFWTTGFINPVNLGPSIYWGSIFNDGNVLQGFDANPGDQWSAVRKSVPEPASLALMSLGLLGVGLARRKRALIETR